MDLCGGGREGGREGGESRMEGGGRKEEGGRKERGGKNEEERKEGGKEGVNLKIERRRGMKGEQVG